MHGSNFSFRIIEFTDFPEYDPGKEKSWVRRFLGTNSPVALTPNCYATPIGDITRPGISIALCNGNINPHPFLIYLTRASLINFPFSFADLWFPMPRVPFRSASLDFPSSSSIGHSMIIRDNPRHLFVTTHMLILLYPRSCGVVYEQILYLLFISILSYLCNAGVGALYYG